jgi:hypothetical protein
MNRDICVIIARMVQLLQDRESYKDFLAYRETDAQALLDLLQDVSTSLSIKSSFHPNDDQFLDFGSFSVVKPLICKALLRLSHASGLHPRCFALPELQKVGDQIAAGGFGDIWKGLVRGQSVCVKVMRLFQNADIQAVLKVPFSTLVYNVFLKCVYLGVQSGSAHLAPTLSPEPASLLRSILFG